MDNKTIYKFDCGFEGTLYDHWDNCEIAGWRCIENGLLKYGEEAQKKRILNSRRQEDENNNTVVKQ